MINRARGLLVKATAVSLVLACSLALAQPVARAHIQRFDLNIPHEPLDRALSELSRVTGVQIARMSDQGPAVGEVGPLKGQFELPAALGVLLQGTPLRFEFVTGRLVRIYSADTPSAPDGTPERSTPAAGPASTAPDRATPQVAPTSPDRNFNTSRQPQLEEIVVTAQKRAEYIRDVPVPVTALSPETLAESGKTRLQDYFAEVPGLSLNAASYGGGGQQNLAIRGLTTASFSNPTVGITIDDVPFGASSAMAWGAALYPDIDPSDLTRIEVLRGPQGTLYGANSIGGLIKFVTVDPSTAALSGRAQLLGSDVHDGGTGHGARAAVNVPLSDSLAIRVSAFDRRDPGYVDNVLTGQRNVNVQDVYGGRLAALWHVADAVSLKLSAQFQNTHGGGNPAVDANERLQPTLGDWKQARLPGTERFESSVQLYSATLKARLGDLDLTSISGYGINRYHQLQDDSLGLAYYAQQPPFLVSGGTEANIFETRKLSQEVRLSSTGQGRVDWLAGLLYTHEKSPSHETNYANDLVTGQAVGLLGDFRYPTTATEYAAYGDVTLRFTDRLDLQLGGRWSSIRQTYEETDTGPVVPDFYNNAVSPAITPLQQIDANAFTYLVTPRFKISPDLMVYTRFASGYREGGPNATSALYGVPAKYDPDKTNNYELGVKGSFFDRGLTLDMSVYYIDWKHIQIYVYQSASFAYLTNGANAHSRGLELSLQARPFRGVRIAASGSIGKADLAADLPQTAIVVGRAGDRLPYSSRFSGNLSLDQDVFTSGHWTGTLGASVNYVGNRLGEFSYTASTPRLVFPGYAQVDVHAGLTHGNWLANLYLNNVADRHGIVGGNTGTAQSPYYAVFIQPRTLGLSLTVSF